MTDATSDTALALTADPIGRGRYRITARLAGAIVHADTGDPASAAYRRRYARALAERVPAVDPEMIDAELLRLAGTPAAAPTVDPAAPAALDLLRDTPPDVIDDAARLLDDPALIGRVCDAVSLLGVAGERELAATIYLVGVSRLLPRPLAAIIRGSSSSGKSYVVETVARLYPPEAVIHATQMTPQALYHLPPGSLSHRWVVSGERSRIEDDERAEATRALREMLASGRLVKLMPSKVDGAITTQAISQDGPIAYIETTTLAYIFEEDANRCLLLQTDESPEQTRRIIRAAAQRQSTTPPDLTRTVAVWHALQRMIPRDPVVVPWLDRLAEQWRCDRIESRRAFPQVCGMIQASALLHHRQRDRNPDGAIVADARDYHLARRLLAHPLAVALGGGVPEAALRCWERLPAGETWTAADVATRQGVSRSAAKGWVALLHDAGLIEVAEAGRGRQPTRWRRTDRDPDQTADLLPPVEAIFGDYTHAHTVGTVRVTASA